MRGTGKMKVKRGRQGSQSPETLVWVDIEGLWDCAWPAMERTSRHREVCRNCLGMYLLWWLHSQHLDVGLESFLACSQEESLDWNRGKQEPVDILSAPMSVYGAFWLQSHSEGNGSFLTSAFQISHPLLLPTVIQNHVGKESLRNQFPALTKLTKRNSAYLV